MAEQDSGWLQLYCENVTDIFDYIIMGYKIAEHRDVLTPIMVCFDGFFLSHSMQKVLIPEQEEIDTFIGDYEKKNVYLDPANPIVINNLTPPEEFTEMRYQQKAGFDNSSKIMDEIFSEYEKKFGRKHKAVEGYRLDEAEVVLVALGSLTGIAKYVVNKLRNEGKKVGVLKIVSFRPFRHDLVKKLLKGIKRIAVFDRTAGLGSQGGPLWHEVKNSVNDYDTIVRNYIGGLGAEM